jgi:hypothetical protein
MSTSPICGVVGGLVVKNVVICFDVAGGTSATKVMGLLEQSVGQAAWYHRDTGGPWQRDALPGARDAIGAAYEFLCREWEPGDRIFVFGAGRGGYCAHALSRVLGMVGVLPAAWTDLVDFALSAYALPRTPRTLCDWWRVRHLIEDLNGDVDVSVSVAFLGTWDAVRAPGLPPLCLDAHANVAAARHALAIEGGLVHHRQVMPTPSDGVDAVWFRGGHCDVAGGQGACEPLAGIAVDWVLDGALAAGASVPDGMLCPTPAHADALAGSVHGMALRRPPVDAHVHASVAAYLQAHPEYWRRLPPRIVWDDAEWLARGERLVAVAPPTAASARQADFAAVAS